MRLLDGLWWPDHDVHCWDAVGREVVDVNMALPYVKGRNLCIQAGGNCGIWARHLAKQFSEVWSIEADLDNYLCLVRNIPANVRPMWAALGDTPGTAEMECDPKNVGAHYVCGSLGRIPVITIDELELTACDLITLDIEGMEALALAGAKQTIEKFKPVLMIEDKGLSDKYGAPRGWTAQIEGYKIVDVVHRDVILVPDV